MKNYKPLILIMLFSFGGSCIVLSQALVNNYAKIYVKQGAQVFIKTNSVNNNALIDNGGDLTIEQDFINNDTANGGGGNGVYRVQRDWINNATFIANQSKVYLYGADQLITGTSVTRFYDLQLTGSGIKRQTINAETSNILALNDRELATDDYEMLVSNTATNAITRSSGFVSCTTTGRLSRTTNSSSTYLFPTGSSTGTPRYRPVNITPSQPNNNTFGARLANTDATAETFDRAMKDTSICEINPLFYHRLYHDAGSDPAAIEIHYDPASDGDWQDIAHWQNIPQWEATNAIASINAPFSTYLLNGWTDFTTFPFALLKKGPNFTFTPSDASCKGASDGAVTTSVSGGQVPYQYDWSTGDTTASLTDIAGGTYFLTVTDSSGCALTESVTIDEPALLASIASLTQVLCSDGNTGGIKLIPLGGTFPYRAVWSNGDTMLTLTSLTPGIYHATITDLNGCTHDTSFNLTTVSTYSVNATSTNTSCTGISSGSLQADISSASTPPFTYLWSTGDTTAFVGNVGSGSYTVTVIDALNCPKTSTVTVGIDGLTIEALVENQKCPGIPDGSIQTIVSGGTTPYSFVWNTGSGSSSLLNIAAGIYSLTVTDLNNCEGNDTILVLSDSTGTFDCDTLLIYNTFSPNGDGTNDLWIIDGITNDPENHLQIYNRWGNIIYEASPYNNDWDGRSKKNEHLPVGTYYYILKLNDTNSSVYSGSVTLIR